MKAFVLLLLFVGYCHCVTFYGVTDYITNENTTITTTIIQIDFSSGKFTPLFENVVYTNELFQITGGDTAFDNKNKLMYYADNGDNINIVYAVDVVGMKVVKSYYNQASDILGVEYDESEGLLFISGMYGSDTGLTVIPVLNKGPMVFYNLSEIFKGADFYAGGTYDSTNQIYYNVYSANVNGKTVQGVASLDFKTNTTHSQTVNCGDNYIFGLTADPANKRLISVGPSQSTTESFFLTIDPSSFSCEVTSMGNLQTISFLYDQTADMLYLLYSTTQHSYVGTYDIAKKTVSTPVMLDDNIEAFAFSY